MSLADRTKILRGVACAVALGAMTIATAGCGEGVVADYPSGYYADSPPDEYIATAEPVYYDGTPAYWYGGFWYYRGAGGRWSHYGREPGALYQHRMQSPPGRRVYERGGGRGGGRSMGRGGGGRGGGRR